LQKSLYRYSKINKGWWPLHPPAALQKPIVKKPKRDVKTIAIEFYYPKSLRQDYPCKATRLLCLFAKAVKGFLMHVFGFKQNRFHEVVTCTKPRSYFTGFPHKAVGLALLLAGIGKMIAMPAKKIFSSSIKERYSPPAPGANKPFPLSAIVTGCAVK
jgi:hypothetical protein